MTQKQWTPPSFPREWTITIAHPKSATMAPVLEGDPAAMMTGDEADAYAQTLNNVPLGWEIVGVQQISPGKRGPILPTDRRQLRIILHPVSWQRQQLAPIAVYAAAQIAGLRTRLDDVMIAAWDWLQYKLPTGQPTYRNCTRWQDDLPAEICAALGHLEYVGERERVGYAWGRPEHGRADQAAMDERDFDRERSRSSIAVIQAWILAEYPQILA